MSPELIGLIVVIVVVLAIILALKTKRSELPEGKKEQKEKEKPRLKPIEEDEKPEEGAKPETTRDEDIDTEAGKPEPSEEELRKPTTEEEPEQRPEEEPEPSAPSEPTPVKLDDEAEDKAVEELENERRERKLKRLRQGLAPTRSGLIAKIGKLFKSKKTISPQLLDELEETLLTSDVGAKTAQKLLDSVKDALDKNELSDADAVFDLLREAVREILSIESKPISTNAEKPLVIMVVGVNGVGKTTTIGKLATKFSDQGHDIVLAAGDTFRAAAVNQLTIWGRRSNSEVVKSKEGADPSSVVFDAIKRAKEADKDIVIADTAGRLHTKLPLMEELKKIGRVMGKAHEGAPHETLLVLDATTGQNAIQQVSMFKEILNITGLVLTKLDGTAKGGVIIGICHEHAIPVRYIGIGESKEDLREFDVSDFVDALFSQGSK